MEEANHHLETLCEQSELKEEQMELIVDMIDRVLSEIENEANIAAVRKEVNELMAQYPLFAW